MVKLRTAKVASLWCNFTEVQIASSELTATKASSRRMDLLACLWCITSGASFRWPHPLASMKEFHWKWTAFKSFVSDRGTFCFILHSCLLSVGRACVFQRPNHVAQITILRDHSERPFQKTTLKAFWTFWNWNFQFRFWCAFRWTFVNKGNSKIISKRHNRGLLSGDPHLFRKFIKQFGSERIKWFQKIQISRMNLGECKW